jgi:hypothetical protein
MKYLLLLLLFPLVCFAQNNPNIYINQVGDNNTYNVSQEYSGDYIKITAGFMSPVDGNSFTVTQNGTGSLIAGIDLQSGINNTFNVIQGGSGNNVAKINGVVGDANGISVTQSGASNNTFILSTTAGTINSANTVNVTQSGNSGADKSFSLTLNGSSGATVTVIQDNPTVSNSGSMTISCLICGSYSYIRH